MGSFNGSLTQHYESLPLTTTEVLLESTPSSTPTKTRGEEIERNEVTRTRNSQSSHKSPNHNRVTDTERKNDPDLTEELLQQTVTTPKWRTIDIEIEKEKESSATNARVSNKVSPNAGTNGESVEKSSNPTLPKQSFFDEMIDLLTEKLGDPGNYGTVLDTKNTSSDVNQQTLYQDPVNLQKDG